MTEERAPYDAGQDNAPGADHAHHFQFVASNKHVIRYCNRCGRSWMIGELHELIRDRTIPCWTEILEEAATRDKLSEL